MTEPGLLGALGTWIAQGSPPGLTRPRLVLLGDPDESVVAVADQLGVGVRVLGPSAGYDGGVGAVDEEVDTGTDLILLAAAADDDNVAATVAVAALTETEPVHVLGFDSGLDDETWVRRTVAVRDGLLPLAGHLGDPKDLLAALDDPTMATVAGVVAQAVARRTPVVLDGLTAVAAALIVALADPDLPSWLKVAGHSADPACRLGFDALKQTPLLDLRRPGGDGLAALLVLPLLRAGKLVPAD